MSPRAMQRAHQRRVVRQARRAGVAAGAASLLLASSAHATTYEVDVATDGPASACGVGNCTLRDATTLANATAGDDSITFKSTVTGTITLTQGELPIGSNDKLTITGPGKDLLTISGDKNANSAFDVGTDSRIFNVTGSGAVAISGLTLTRGLPPADAGSVDPADTLEGGALVSNGSGALSLTDAAITNSRAIASGFSGGGIALDNSDQQVILTRVTLSGNSAPSGAGGALAGEARTVDIVDSTITGNTAKDAGGGFAMGGSSYGAVTVSGSTLSGNSTSATSKYSGGGAGMVQGGSLKVDRSTITGNTSGGSGGGLMVQATYGATITDSTISGNTAAKVGGGVSVFDTTPQKYSPVLVDHTTIAGNHAPHGGGFGVLIDVGKGAPITIARSAIIANDGPGESYGGGVYVGGDMNADMRVVDTTISGNTAKTGGAASFGYAHADPADDIELQFNPTNGKHSDAVLSFESSTISGNTGTAKAGGIYLAAYNDRDNAGVRKSGVVTLISSIVGANAGADLDRADGSTTGGFETSFSLVQNAGDGPIINPVSNLLGVDPKLGALGDNGGPTPTMLPAATSPVIDQGRSDTRDFPTDQRDAARLVQTALGDAANGGDGSDIGAVELAASQVTVPPPAPPVTVPAPTMSIGVRLRSAITGTPLTVAGVSPVSCTYAPGTLTSCTLDVRDSKGTPLATGKVAKSGIAIATTLRLTADGRAVLKKNPLGVDAVITAVGQTGSSAQTATGKVHLIGSSSFTVTVGSRKAKLSSAVLKSLDKIAGLLNDTTAITCSAYTSAGKGDTALTKKQATSACARLKAKGAKGKLTSSGKGHAKPLSSNRTAKGRKANQRLIISFKF